MFYLLKFLLSVDASYFTVIYVPTPHCCVSAFYDVIRTENSRSFFRSNTDVGSDKHASLLEQNLDKLARARFFLFSPLVCMFQC